MTSRGASPGAPPGTAEDFAEAVIRAICAASVTAAVAQRTYERCRQALAAGATVRMGFRHAGKADAIDRIWRERESLYARFTAAADQDAFLATLPWVGTVTRRHLAGQFGLVDAATGPHPSVAARAAA